jgi:hypothetical protein
VPVAAAASGGDRHEFRRRLRDVYVEEKISSNIYKIVYVPFSHDLKKDVALKTSDAHASKFTVDVAEHTNRAFSKYIPTRP